jgi:lactate dehydrogenase-like 2-hydroxyacid dehydrogenase
MRALLLENIHSDAVAQLKADGYDVETVPGALSEDELIAALPGVDLLGIRSTTYVTDKVLASTDQLQAIGAFCIGTNQIDLQAASSRGVAVFNAPYSNTRSVVEIAIGSIVALARRLTDKNAPCIVGSGTSRRGIARGTWAGAGHRRVRQHRLAAVGARRGVRYAGVLLRHRRPLALGNAPAAAAWRSCSRPPRWCRCTWTDDRATRTCSDRHSSPPCARGPCS